MSDHLDLAAIEARARDPMRCNVSAEDREATLALVARVRMAERQRDGARALLAIEARGAEEGCDSGSCIFGPPRGQHTNGPCHCHGDLPQKGRLHLHRCVAAMRRRCTALREALARAVLKLGNERERAEKAEAACAVMCEALAQKRAALGERAIEAIRAEVRRHRAADLVSTAMEELRALLAEWDALDAEGEKGPCPENQRELA